MQQDIHAVQVVVDEATGSVSLPPGKIIVGVFRTAFDVPQGYMQIDPNDLHRMLGYPHQGVREAERRFRQMNARRQKEAWNKAADYCRPRSDVTRRVTYSLDVHPISASDALDAFLLAKGLSEAKSVRTISLCEAMGRVMQEDAELLGRLAQT